MSKLIKLTNPEEVPELIKEAICYYRGCYPQYSDAEIARRVNKNLDCISIDEKLVLEILELALSTSFDHNKLQQKFENHSKVLKTYQNLAYNLASSLKAIFKSIENHKKYVSWLDKAAIFFLSLKDKNGKNIPILFRPFHELTGGWFWWGKGNCTPEEFKTAWKFTFDYLQKKGVHNLIYVYNTADFKSKEEFLEYYPGSDYADAIGEATLKDPDTL